MGMRKSLTALTITAAAVATGFFGSTLVKDVQFARAEADVQATRQQLNQASDLSTVFREVGKVVEPSVVEIQVRKTIPNPHRNMPDFPDLRRFFRDQIPGDNGDDNGNGNGEAPDLGPDNGGNDNGGSMEEVGTGSGVIMEVDGSDAYILTNNHVAGGATEMLITLNDGREIKNGKVLGTDPKTDLAVVKINADHLIAAKWGDSDKLEKGDWVLAFGAPFGYVGSMTHGIVSALHRQAGILGQLGYENFIQVDAPINPGNSGGPLTNTRGEVVGINTAIATTTRSFAGIGFAIPSNQAKTIYTTLKTKGKVVRGWLGVSIIDVAKDHDEAVATGYSGTAGVLIKGTMPNTPASGKLDAGDIITAVNGKKIITADDLRTQVAMTPPNTDLKLTVFRNGKTQDVTVKVGEQPADMAALRNGANNPANGENGAGNVASNRNLGLTLADVSDELSQRFNLDESGIKSGAVIVNVRRNSPAARLGLRPGDVITRVGGTAVHNAADANAALKKADPAKGIALVVANAEGSHYVVLKVSPQSNNSNNEGGGNQ